MYIAIGVHVCATFTLVQSSGLQCYSGLGEHHLHAIYNSLIIFHSVVNLGSRDLETLYTLHTSAFKRQKSLFVY